MSLIKVNRLSREFKDGRTKATALSDVSFEISEGESAAIIGASGSGKTTMLHMLGGLDKPTSGEVIVNGKPLHKMSDNELSNFRNKTIGFVFQFFYLLEYLTALENITIPMIASGSSKSNALKKANELIELVGLSDRKNHYPHELSGGEMQRIAIARALINDPKLILADEPTGNLDAANAANVINIFKEIGKKGVSVVLITHDSKVSDQFERVIRLDKGNLIFN